MHVCMHVCMYACMYVIVLFGVFNPLGVPAAQYKILSQSIIITIL